MKNLSLYSTEFELPSQGCVYEESVLGGSSSVSIRPMVAADQKILAGSTGDSYKLYRKLLSAFIVTPEKVLYDELLLSDIQTLLFVVRINTYGSEYHYNFKCPDCGAKEVKSLDFGILDIKTVTDLDSPLESDYEISLSNGDNLVLTRGRLKHEKQTRDSILRLKKRGAISTETPLDIAFVKLSHLIKSINEQDKTPQDALSYLDGLSIPLFDELTEHLDHDIGISPRIFIECDGCGWADEIRVPIDAEFFRPKRTRGRSSP